MKLRILSLILLLSTLLSFSACKKTNGEEDFDEKGPLDIRVYTLNGTTGFGMAKMMEDAENGAFEWENYQFEVKSDASEILAALTSGDADIAALPTNAAATVYNKTQGGVKILAINTLGCLYLVNSGSTEISSISKSKLSGKTVYVPAQNPTFIMTHLCQKSGLTVITEGTPKSGEVLLDSTSYATPAALRDAVAAGQVDLAVLPEPMVTIAVNKAAQASVTLNVDLDLTQEWDRIVGGSNTLVQGCVVVRTDFLEAHPLAVDNFLTAYEASINYLNQNTEDTATLIKKHEIFENEAVAKQAIPKCNIKFISGKTMKSSVSTYLQILNEINSQSIGGKLPGDDFYYHANI